MHNLDGADVVMEADISFVTAMRPSFSDYPVLLDDVCFPLQRFSH